MKETFPIENQSQIFPIACNLSNHEDRNCLISKSIQMMSGLDGLVCNAGITKDNLAIRMTDETWEDVLDINLTSSFRLNADAIKFMIKQRSGSIVNISSIVGCIGNADTATRAANEPGGSVKARTEVRLPGRILLRVALLP